jgi:hypothetical protein
MQPETFHINKKSKMTLESCNRSVATSLPWKTREKSSNFLKKRKGVKYIVFYKKTSMVERYQGTNIYEKLSAPTFLA